MSRGRARQFERGCAALIAGLLLAARALAGGITEYSISAPVSFPRALTTGPDGNLWFIGQNGLGRMTPTGAVTTFSVPDFLANGFETITAGPDGNLWFTNTRASLIWRATTSGALTSFSGVGQPAGITWGPDGNLWVTDYSFGGGVSRMTPAGAITRFLTGRFGAITSITAGPDGALWFAERDAGTIGRITTSGDVSEFRIPTPAALPVEIVSGPDGNLWFTDSGSTASQIGRITSAGVITEYPTRDPRAYPEGLAVGPDGALWYTQRGVDGIARISVSGVMTEFLMPGVIVSNIALGPDRFLWVTDAVFQRLLRISTSGSATVFPVPGAGGEPEQIVAGADGNLWFVERSGHKVGRITTAGSLQEFPLPGSLQYPSSITVAPDRNIWISAIDQASLNGQICRVAPDGSFACFPLPGVSASALTAGPDQNLWFTSGDARVAKMTMWGDPSFVAAQPPGDILRSMTLGPDGNLWFVNQATNAISRMTTSGAVTTFPIPTPASQPWSITTGSDGALWFTEVYGNKIGRISTDGSIVEYPLPPMTILPAEIAPGPDGALWFGLGYPSVIGRMTTAGRYSEFAAPRGAGGITTGPDGNVWFTEGVWNRIAKGVPGRMIEAAPRTIQVPPATVFHETVLSFTVSGLAVQSDFTATVDWGQGPQAAEAIRPNPTGGFDVIGSNSFPVEGAYPIQVRVEDSGVPGTMGNIIRAQCTVIVSRSAVQPLEIAAPAALPVATVGAFYSVVFTGVGGISPYVFQFLGDSPPGFALGPGGYMEGSPAVAGSYSFVVEVSDSIGLRQTRGFTLTVVKGPSILTPTSLPAGSTTRDYGTILQASDGAGPLRWAAEGSLPKGLSLSSDGALAGRPHRAGRFSFSVRVTDSNGAFAQRLLTLEIARGTVVVAPR